MAQLHAAEAELEELNKQLKTFEAMVDARLGALLDQLSDLNVETITLDEQLRAIREQRLFGTDLIRYLDGAPRSARQPGLRDLPPQDLPQRKAATINQGAAFSDQEFQPPEIKAIYRKLARRHHPDLARSDTDRLYSTETMAEINRLYQEGDLPALMRLAGMSVPYGVTIPAPLDQAHAHTADSPSQQEQVEKHLKAVRLEIERLSRLPIVKLSLDVKLAARQNRDLLREMANELQYKVKRKMAECDYLQAQINASGTPGETSTDKA